MLLAHTLFNGLCPHDWINQLHLLLSNIKSVAFVDNMIPK